MLVRVLLVLLVAANGALTVLPRSVTGPGVTALVAHLIGPAIAGAESLGASDADPPIDEGSASLLSSRSTESTDGFVPLDNPSLPVRAPIVNDRDALLTTNTFRLDVPFHTQKDGGRYQGADCGPASLAMVLDAFGTEQSNWDLRVRSHAYQGGIGGGTALQFVARAANDFGVGTVGLYDGPDTFHRWNVDEIRGELQVGRPVVPLVKYRLLPGHEATTIRWDHYIVIYGVDGDRFLYHDPSYSSPQDGAARWITSGQLTAAMSTAIVPSQAVAFDPGSHDALAAASV